MIYLALLISGILGQVSPYVPLSPLDPYGWGSVADKPGTATKTWSASWAHSPSVTFTATTATTPTAIAPSWECWASQYAGGATWPCTGVTFSKYGTPAQVESPFYPVDWSTNVQSVNFDASTEYFDSSATAGYTTAYTCWALIRPTDISATRVVMGKKSASLADWYLQIGSAGNAYLAVYNAAGTSTNGIISANGTIVANEWAALAVAYEYVGAGTSLIRGNWNGVAGTGSSSAVGPVRDSSGAYSRIGKGGSSTFVGDFYAGGCKDSWAASASQLVTLTRSLRGLIPTYGASEVAFTRAGVESCTPKAGASTFLMGAHFPCIASAGLQMTSSAATLSYSSQLVSAGEKCYSITIGSGITDETSTLGLFGHNAASGTNIFALQHLNAGVFAIQSGDSAGTLLTGTAAGSLVGGTTLVACSKNSSRKLRLTIGGTSRTITKSGAGSGVQTAEQTTVYLGRDASAGNLLTGHVSAIVECTGWNPAQCL